MYNQNHIKKILHFVGIGGIGMSGIAEIMHNEGYIIQGSDIAMNYNAQRLIDLGVKVFIGHNADNVEGADYVVLSSAIPSDNIEVIQAKQQHIPILTRAEVLAELMRLKTSIAVSGSHGKTTTTSLVASIFEKAGIHPTVINGGIINGKMTNAYLGRSEYLIAEADESDATFINIPATIAVITNIDVEHLDFYHNFDNILAAFERFILNLPFYGFAVLCIDNVHCARLAEKITNRKIITYSIENEGANIFAYNIRCGYEKSIFDVKITLPSHKGHTIIENIAIPILGIHNVSNALAAISIAAELNFGIHTMQKAFENFKGVKRRFTKVCEYNGATIIDDYAHHPAEITAVINTAKLFSEANNSKIMVFFQPHRYSRFKDLYQDFLKVFNDVEYLFVLPIYASGENVIEGISSQNFIKDITHKHAQYIEDIEDIQKQIKLYAQPSDMILFLGAGNISFMANNLKL